MTLINAHPGEYITVVPGALDTDVTKGNTAAFNQGWTSPARVSRPQRPSARRWRTRSSTPRASAFVSRR